MSSHDGGLVSQRGWTCHGFTAAARAVVRHDQGLMLGDEEHTAVGRRCIQHAVPGSAGGGRKQPGGAASSRNRAQVKPS
ncbi:hypothetical protein [Streptomyces sp. NPDC018693]|uniref:hypothetical protein n=1 Tax=unclassified Streptomyces TaxID=2593676 RepID=UPI0037A60C29